MAMFANKFRASTKWFLVNALYGVVQIILVVLLWGDACAEGWKKTHVPGISLRTESITGESPLKIYAARVDTKNASIRFLVTPSNGSDPADAAAMGTSEFLEKYGCQLAVNGSVFSPYARQKGDPLDILGLSLSEGNVYSKPNRYHALLISKSGKVSIAEPPFTLDGVKNGLSGYYTILKNGKNLGSERKKEPRTVAGVSKDGRFLILAVFDGRQPGYSDGATLREAADWVRRFGAWTALNMDGGGSSTLVVRTSEDKPKILNQPSEGAERRIANHLCVLTARSNSK